MLNSGLHIHIPVNTQTKEEKIKKERKEKKKEKEKQMLSRNLRTIQKQVAAVCTGTPNMKED